MVAFFSAAHIANRLVLRASLMMQFSGKIGLLLLVPQETESSSRHQAVDSVSMILLPDQDVGDAIA